MPVKTPRVGGLDLRVAGNRAAVMRELARRKSWTAQQAAGAEFSSSVKVPLLEDGSIDRSSDVHIDLLTRFEALDAMLPGEAKTLASGLVLRAAVLARHWEIAIGVLQPSLTAVPFSEAHLAIYRWWHSLDEGRPRPLVVCVNRGGGKTTSLELICAFTAMEALRNYVLYVHARKEKAADSVENVANFLTLPVVRAAFPNVGEPHKTAQGNERDWRKERVRTASGFTIDALGMDQALRGAKIDDDRPGLIVLDDLESEQDSPKVTAKKIENVTKAIIPTLARNGAVAFVENLIHEDSMMARIIDGRADYLTTRVLVGPIPQVRDLRVAEIPKIDREEGGNRFRIIEGEATWEGLNLEASEDELNTIGLNAFLSEKQHSTDVAMGDKFDPEDWTMVDAERVPAKFTQIVRAWDLAGSDSPEADFTVGVLMGVCEESFYWILDVARGQWKTSKVEDMIVTHALEDQERYGRFGYTCVIERQIGTADDHWKKQIRKKARSRFAVKWEKPNGPKVDRANLYASSQQQEEIRLVKAEWNSSYCREHGNFPDWKNDDQVDAGVYAHRHLSVEPSRRRSSMKTQANRNRSNSRTRTPKR